jgi:ribonuclease P/MRP protein subunit RPP1
MSVFKKNLFYEFHVTPESSENILEMAAIARRFGYAGMAVTADTGLSIEEQDLPSGFSIYRCVELTVNNAFQVRRKVQKWHKKVDCVILRGGSESVNRAAVETSQVDVLASAGRLNHILAKLATEHDVAVEFDLGTLIRSSESRRCEILTVYRSNLKLVRKYRTPFILTITPTSPYDFRTPREMAALAMLFGMSKEEAVCGMSRYPREILERHSPDFIAKGVRLV